MSNSKQSDANFQLADRSSPGTPRELKSDLKGQAGDEDPTATDAKDHVEETRPVDTATAVEDDELEETPPANSQPNPSKEPKEDEQPAINYPTAYKLLTILSGTSLIFFAVLLDQSILSTAVPQITSDFHSLPDVGWYSGAYQLTSATLQPLTGKMYTYFHMKWTFLVFFIIFEIGSLVCALATSSSFFIAGRAVAGIGVSGLTNGTLSIVAASVPLEKRAFYLGILIGIGQLGLVSGPLIGGSLTQYATWRWCFWINLPLGAVAGLALLFIRIPELTAKPPFSLRLIRSIIPELDPVGFVLFVPAAVLLLLALQFGSGYEYAWNSPVIIGLLVGAVVASILFVLWEQRAGEAAIIPASMLSQRIVWTSGLQYSSLLGAIFIGTQYFPIYFQAAKGVSPALSGVYLLPSILSQLLFVMVSGALITRIGYYLPFATLAGIGATIGSGLISTWSYDTPTGEWVGYQILYGLRGCGIQIVSNSIPTAIEHRRADILPYAPPQAVVAVQNALPPKQITVGTAFLVFCSTFTASVFIVIGNAIFTQSLVSEILRLAPSVDPAATLAAGGSADAVRGLLPAGSPELEGLLQAFSLAFDKVCYFMLALAAVSVIASFGMGWVDVRKKPKREEAA
ncbi:major facilitator superfamily domain-containing protein [Nemania abortiva]|nr:major facilitator superfamily domain-containing protein [Nemania abortiva]